MSTTTIEVGRLRRALTLKLDRIGEDRWMSGGRLVEGRFGCTCEDARLRGRRDCKHALRVRLRDVDDELIDALRGLVEASGR